MKRMGVVALVALMAAAIAASPAAAAKKKKPARPAVLPVGANTNEASARLVMDGLPIFLPSWAIWLYVNGTGRAW